MGLAPDRAARGDARIRFWLVPAALLSVILLLGAGGEAWRLELRYDRAAIEAGDAWRLLTGHLVHLGWSHLAMNALAFAAIWLLVGFALDRVRWLLVLLATIAVIDAGFWWLAPELAWYVGFSGVLHGLLAAGIVAGWPARRGELLFLAAGLVAKLLFEQFYGAVPGSAATAGGPVIVDAHLYGAVGGALAGLVARVSVAVKPSI